MNNEIMDGVLKVYFFGLVLHKNFFTTVFCWKPCGNSTNSGQKSFYSRPTSLVLTHLKDRKNPGKLLVQARINFPDGVFVEIPQMPDTNEEQGAIRCILRTPRRFGFGLLPARRVGAILSVK